MSSPQNTLQHIGIIMDGNGRWAQKRAMPRPMGHKFGAKVTRNIIQAAIEHDISYLTLYVFSAENWQRPQKEVTLLMKLLVEMIRKEIGSLMEQNVRVKALGDLSVLPDAARKEMLDTLEQTSKNTGMTLLLALSYGGRAEIVEAAKRIAKEAQDSPTLIDTLDEESFEKYLYEPDLPHPELIIRTGGDQRISNFLLWQSAYAELYFSPVLWPDYTKEHFQEALDEYSQRERRFGKVL